MKTIHVKCDHCGISVVGKGGEGWSEYCPASNRRLFNFCVDCDDLLFDIATAYAAERPKQEEPKKMEPAPNEEIPYRYGRFFASRALDGPELEAFRDYNKVHHADQRLLVKSGLSSGSAWRMLSDLKTESPHIYRPQTIITAVHALRKSGFPVSEDAT
jgi:hypothetical protein